MPFDIGFFELCVIIIVALLVLGPERLPVAARALGRWFGKAQRAFTSVKNEINRELQLDELRQQLKEQQQKMDQLINQQELGDLQQQIEETRAAFRREMEQQQAELNRAKEEASSDASEKTEGKSEEAQDDMSGCKNPVEFEPLPRKDDPQADQHNTIHQEPSSPKTGS